MDPSDPPAASASLEPAGSRTAVSVPPVVPEPGASIRDLAGMFFAVSLAEAVRDTSRDLIKFASHDQVAASPVVATLAESYNRLRVELAETLEPEVRDALLDRAAVLQPSTVDVFSVYAAAVTLVRLVGVLHKTPQFLLSEQVEATAAKEITDRLTSGATARSPLASDGPGDEYPQVLGAYL